MGEDMRIEDAIAGAPQYARDYEEAQGRSGSYADLVSRTYDLHHLGRKALDGTNVFRGEQRVPPMRWCHSIADIAAAHACQMAKGEMPFSHKGFDERVRRYPFPHLAAAENLAYNGG